MDLADIGTDALILELERRDAVCLMSGEFLVDHLCSDRVDRVERAKRRLLEGVVSELCSLVQVEDLGRDDVFFRYRVSMRVVR